MCASVLACIVLCCVVCVCVRACVRVCVCESARARASEKSSTFGEKRLDGQPFLFHLKREQVPQRNPQKVLYRESLLFWCVCFGIFKKMFFAQQQLNNKNVHNTKQHQN